LNGQIDCDQCGQMNQRGRVANVMIAPMAKATGIAIDGLFQGSGSQRRPTLATMKPISA